MRCTSVLLSYQDIGVNVTKQQPTTGQVNNPNVKAASALERNHLFLQMADSQILTIHYLKVKQTSDRYRCWCMCIIVPGKQRS